ncbi:MAG: 16S rRNA (cytosine(1402)-N(4))-methyltransferase, partial [Hyphomicrobiales bacterium]
MTTGSGSGATGGPARHKSVMLPDVLEALAPRDGGVYVDGTFGAGGYSHAILEAADCRVIALDRDPQAVREAGPMLAQFGERLTLIEGRFSELAAHLAQTGAGLVDGVVFDLGVSSMQLDRPQRGFSFRTDGPLDMRMGADGPSAADLVETMD